MKAIRILILLWIGALWRHLTAAGHNLTTVSCRHQWGRDKGSKLMGCGKTGCAFDVHSEEGVRGVKKMYFANSSVRNKHGLPLKFPFIFESAVETLQLLDGECSVGPALDICYGDNGYIPYIVYAWKGHTTIQSYYLDARRPIPGDLLLSWFVHAMQVVAPCVANHGLVVFDTSPRHALIDPTGALIPAGEFVLIDADAYSPSWLWGTGWPQKVNSTAAFVNRIYLADLLIHTIFNEGLFLFDSIDILEYVREHLHTLMVMNDHVMQIIDRPDIFHAKTLTYHAVGSKFDVFSNALNFFFFRSHVPIEQWEFTGDRHYDIDKLNFIHDNVMSN